ncbi:MAG: glycosyl transferase [Prevotella ruminicola]|uniref:Glycosyl transferase n=1 Tax=Xylanibacter ruminicola TaxID=839 RepID=A0A9D5S8F6_XYLRU|nr:glycosyl transferase [Xylanibacter ruminicola]
MIPKIIHYCWFGGNPLPELAQRCIASWRKFLPDYEIKEWNEDNFDVNIIPYTAEAYRQKKYAFVSDYARFWIMYKYGGIYFDTDVEVIRSMDDMIAQGNFMGFEQDPDGENTPGRYAPRYCFAVALGLGFGLSKEHPFMQRMMDYYSGLEFDISHLTPWSKTIVAHTTEVLVTEGLQNTKGIQRVGDIFVYPHEYFAPINVITGKLNVTANSYTIHWYMGSWDNKKDNVDHNFKTLKIKLRNILPEWFFLLNNRIKRRKYRIR